MNIFALDKDPVKAAQMLCDRHVNKMILESAQMLSAVADRYEHPTIYKVSHKNHPSTLWAGDRRANWQWLIDHALAMEAEKIFRTGKGHKSAEVVRFYRDRDCGPPEDGLPKDLFAMAMPIKYKGKKTVSSYRAYYLGDKQFFKDGRRPRWTKRQPPDWWEFQKKEL